MPTSAAASASDSDSGKQCLPKPCLHPRALSHRDFLWSQALGFGRHKTCRRACFVSRHGSRGGEPVFPALKRAGASTNSRKNSPEESRAKALAVRSGATHALRRPALTVPAANSIPANCNIKVKRHPMKLGGVSLCWWSRRESNPRPQAFYRPIYILRSPYLILTTYTPRGRLVRSESP